MSIFFEQLDADGNPHYFMNVIAPDQSSKLVAFGATSSTNAKLTTHILHNIMEHCRNVLEYYHRACTRGCVCVCVCVCVYVYVCLPVNVCGCVDVSFRHTRKDTESNIQRHKQRNMERQRVSRFMLLCGAGRECVRVCVRPWTTPSEQNREVHTV